jgi:hypothetical protein
MPGDWKVCVVTINGVEKGIAVESENLEFFDSTFLSHVKEFPAADHQPPDPKHDGYCYDHARRLALSSDGELTYADGLGGISMGVKDVGGKDIECFTCMPHAWCLNKAGEVIDPGWDANDGRYYFGVEVPISEVANHQADRESPTPKSTRPILSLDYAKRLSAKR